jgi:hypothetical protein
MDSFTLMANPFKSIPWYPVPSILNRKIPNAGKHIIFASKLHQNFRMVVCDDISTFRQLIRMDPGCDSVQNPYWRLYSHPYNRTGSLGYKQCCGSKILSRIPDPNFFHPGSWIKGQKIPDPGSGSVSKNLSIFTQNVSKLSDPQRWI